MSTQNHITQPRQENLNTEEWKPIKDFEGIYSISNIGRIRRDIKGKNTFKGKILKFRLAKGYPRINLKNKPLNKMFFVHNLVANAFLGIKPEGFEVNHIDGIKINNRPDNLEYITQIENKHHAVKLGLYPRGETHHSCLHPEKMARGKNNGRYVWASKKTHCPHGHELIPENIFPGDKAHGWRRCRECQRIRHKVNRSKPKNGTAHPNP